MLDDLAVLKTQAHYRAAAIVTDSLLAAECFSKLPNITGWAFAGLAAPAHWPAAVLYQMYSIRSRCCIKLQMQYFLVLRLLTFYQAAASSFIRELPNRIDTTQI